MNETEKRKKRQQISKAFSPSAPIAVEGLFAGRTKQLQNLLDAVPQRGRHAIVFGERGVGKTSLAQVLTVILKIDTDGPVYAPYTSCDSTDSFDSIWRKIFADMPIPRESDGTQPVHEGTVGDTIPDNVFLTPEWVRRYLDYYGDSATLVAVIDEFDCFPDASQRKLFAETIKLLSDRASPATVVLVGVAEDVTSLLAEHASVERAIAQVQMPRMSRDELQEILDKALVIPSMQIEPDAAARIKYLSQGLPHYTHLLGLEAAMIAVNCDTLTINLEHVLLAVKFAVANAQASVRNTFHLATMSPHKDNLYGTVLLACAIAQGDEQGYFAAADIRDPICQITGHKYDIPSFSRHLHDFCEDQRGAVLRRIGAKHNFRFRFSSPLLQPYVILKGIADEKISKDLLK
jgi:AAA ATPase domain